MIQATVFNGSCRVWAPEYRQASIAGLKSEGARDLAYSDVLRAFLYFVDQVSIPAPTCKAAVGVALAGVAFARGVRLAWCYVRMRLAACVCRDKCVSVWQLARLHAETMYDTR